MLKLAFGLMRLPVKGDDRAAVDYDQFSKMADEFIAAGGTYFDTAYPYHRGQSEIAFRECVVKRYPRDAFTVTDKLPIFRISTREEAEACFSEQLERCGVEYFDYYFLHAMNASYYEKVIKNDLFGFISEKKAQGKIRHIGFSFHDSPELLDRILCDHPETELVQIQMNYMDWDDPQVCSKRCYDVVRKHGKMITIMEPVKGGALAALPDEAEEIFLKIDPEMSMASWAIRFCAGLPGVLAVLSGMSNVEQMRDNLSYMKDFRAVPEEYMPAYGKVREIIKEKAAFNCTGCKYCVTENQCPAGISIPDCFALYNSTRMYPKTKGLSALKRYEDLAAKTARASECLECGMCEAHCPQRLPIRNYLKEVSAAFDGGK